MSQMRHDYCRAHDLRVAGLLAYASQPMAAPPPLIPVYPYAGQPALRQRALRWPLAAIFDTRVWKPGRSVAETRTISMFWVYMTYRDLVMAALSCWWLICDF